MKFTSKHFRTTSSISTQTVPTLTIPLWLWRLSVMQQNMRMTLSNKGWVDNRLIEPISRLLSFSGQVPDHAEVAVTPRRLGIHQAREGAAKGGRVAKDLSEGSWSAIFHPPQRLSPLHFLPRQLGRRFNQPESELHHPSQPAARACAHGRGLSERVQHHQQCQELHIESQVCTHFDLCVLSISSH